MYDIQFSERDLVVTGPLIHDVSGILGPLYIMHIKFEVPLNQDKHVT